MTISDRTRNTPSDEITGRKPQKAEGWESVLDHTGSRQLAAAFLRCQREGSPVPGRVGVWEAGEQLGPLETLHI